MDLENWNWSAPGVALAVGVGLGLLLVFSRGLWKSLPGWVKAVAFVVIVILFALWALGRLYWPL